MVSEAPGLPLHQHPVLIQTGNECVAQSVAPAGVEPRDSSPWTSVLLFMLIPRFSTSQSQHQLLPAQECVSRRRGRRRGEEGGRKYSSKGNDEATTIFIHPAPLQIDYRLITRHGSDDETF